MDYIKVGNLNKSFGTKGQIRVVPEKAYLPDLLKCDVWFVKKGGEMIPYFVDGIDNGSHLLVKFEDIDNPESTKRLSGGDILLRSKDVTVSEDAAGDDLDKLVGFTVVTEEELIGKISRVEEYPQQLMAFVDLADIDETIMIPLTPAFLLGIDAEHQEVVVQLPDGLIDTQLNASAFDEEE